MKKLSKIVMGLAAMTMLASCAKNVTPEEAAKIANGWSVSAASAYKSYTLVTKDSKGNTSTTEDKHAITVKATIAALLAANVVAVNAAAASGAEGQFKADGNALEFSYKADGESFLYKTNAEGITVYSKTTTADGWSEASYTWYK